MAKKRFKIRARLVFSGEVVIAAATRQEAEAIAEKGLHALLGKVEADPSVEERIKNWEFCTHAETTVKEGGQVMSREETIIRVSFHEAPLAHQPQRREFYFGCLSAIYEVFTPEQVGCKVQNLWNANIRVGSPYVNRLCVISREPFVRKTREKPSRASDKFGQ